MEKQEIIKININDLIALCHVIDQFEEFNKNLTNLFNTTKYKMELIYKLSKISKGKFSYNSKKVKNFYKENKDVIDIINKYTYIDSFISSYYTWTCDSKDVYLKNGELYQYILDNKDKLNKIIAVLEKLKNLKFYELNFSKDLKFSDEKYCMNKRINENINIVYLDNMESIPNYRNYIIDYKTNYSNYKIVIGTLIDKLSDYDKKIFLNDLTFDPDRLPKTLSKEDIIDTIIGLKKESECSNVKNSIDLSIGIDDLTSMLNRFNETINKMDNISSKEELINLLSNIRQEIVSIQDISQKYNSEIIQKNESITEDLLDTEKKEYIHRRFLSSIHID